MTSSDKEQTLTEFEDLLEYVGGFGKYQKIFVLLILIPSLTLSPMFLLGPAFITATPDHWCSNSIIEKSNLSFQMKQKLLRPKMDPYCTMYKLNFSDILNDNFTTEETLLTESCTEGWTYDTSKYESTAITKWNLVCSNSHYSAVIKSIAIIGDTIGCFIFGHIFDTIGRRLTFIILIAIAFITEISSAFVPYFTVFLFLRCINGSVAAAFFMGPYTILLEMVKPNMRTNVSGFALLAFSFGLCLLPLIAWLTAGWIKFCIFNASCYFILCISCIIFLPESPRWLFSKGLLKESTKLLAQIAKVNGKLDVIEQKNTTLLQHVTNLYEHLHGKETLQEKKMLCAIDLIKNKDARKTFFIASLCWMANSAGFYGIQLNAEILNGNEFIDFFLIALAEIPGRFLAWFTMEKYGRKWTTAGNLFITSIACIIPAIFSYTHIIGIICVAVGKFGISAANMSIYTQIPELYPTPFRAIGVSMSAVLAATASLISPYINLLGIYSKSIPFATYSIFNLLAAIFAISLPETLNKKLPQTMTDVKEIYKTSNS